MSWILITFSLSFFATCYTRNHLANHFLGGGENKDPLPLDFAALIIVKSQGKEKNIASV